MISKISKGRGFSGLLAYVSGKKGAEYLCGNVSENPGQAAREMGILRQYSQCKTPVWHCSLSLSPSDRHLTNAEFAALAEKFIAKMGLSANQYCVWRHNDREHAHIHIICNRISLDEKHTLWNAWQDIKRAREAKTQLEIEHQLIPTPHNPRFANPEIGRGQQEKARRTGTIPQKQYIAESIATAAQTGNVEEFIKSLSAKGIEAVPNISTTGRMNGFSFRIGRKHYKGSQLRCAWRELAPRLNYNAEKDNEFLYSLLPQEKRPTPTAEPKEPPRRQYCIYSAREWEKMGGDKNSNYRRAYKMLDKRYSMKDVAQELRLQNPQLGEKQLKKILYNSGKFWIENNRQKLSWAYRHRRSSIRFSSDPMIFLLEVLALLVGAAIKAGFRGIEEHRTRKQIDGISRELEDMAHYAEERVQKKREQAYRHEERAGREREERENPILSHAREISAEMSR